MLFRPLAQPLGKVAAEPLGPQQVLDLPGDFAGIVSSSQSPLSPRCSTIPAFFVAITGSPAAAAVAAASPAKLPVNGSTHIDDDAYCRMASGMEI